MGCKAGQLNVGPLTTDNVGQVFKLIPRLADSQFLTTRPKTCLDPETGFEIVPILAPLVSFDQRKHVTSTPSAKGKRMKELQKMRVYHRIFL